MARDGYRIFDSDTHVGPDARILAGYLSEAEKDRLRGWEPYKSLDRSGHETYTKGQRRYRCRLGTTEPDETPSGYMASGVILAGARDIDGAVTEIRRWGRSSWAWGLTVYAPAGMPLDLPALEPFYAAAAELDLAVVLHTFTVMPPYAPGGQDTWDNLWLQRSAAHPWCGMRNMAAMIGSGVMDRYPSLRVGSWPTRSSCARSAR